MKRFSDILRASVLAVAGLAMVSAAPLSAQDPEPPAAAEEQQTAQQDVAVYDAVIVAEYPHDPEAFTQGLLYHDGYLYESTGRLGLSSVRRVELETGEVLERRDIPADQFGEGLTVWQDELVSLTWQHGIIHRWNRADMSLIESVDGFPFEGWGLTTFGDQLVFSDGSPFLRFINPETFEVERELPVSVRGEPVPEINELEVIDGLIYANIWFTRVIAAIDPETGQVVRLVNLRPVTDLIEMSEPGAVLNGIAYDSENDRIFVTGKLWPSLFEVRFVPRELPPPAEDQPVPVPAE